MSLLYVLGQHDALETVDTQLKPDGDIYGFLDDIYVICHPDRVVDIFGILQTELRRHAGIEINRGKTKVWDRKGIRPNDIETMGEYVWRGDQNLPTRDQGVKILGCPIGHPDYVLHFLENILEKQRVLLNQIPKLEDVQKSWLLLHYCANSRANYYTRVVDPEHSGVYALGHDQCLNEWLHAILGLGLGEIGHKWQQLNQLSFNQGGVGLRSATQLRFCAYRASWADCLEILQ